MTVLSFRRGPSGCPAATVRFAAARVGARPRTIIIQRIVLVIAATLPLIVKCLEEAEDLDVLTSLLRISIAHHEGDGLDELGQRVPHEE